MRLSEGVEWAIHACVMLAALPQGRTLPGAAVAEYLGVPPAYLLKHLQALSRAGLVVTRRGTAGGYRLAKPAEQVTLYDITAAVKGYGPVFRCQEVRQRGPAPASREECQRPCGIATSFYAAERAWRWKLEKVTVAAMLEAAGTAGLASSSARAQAAAQWFAQNVR